MNVKLLTHTPEPEKLVASAAKLCYSAAEIETLMNNLTEDKIDEFINRLSKMGHESPIEHVTFTFGIEDVSRALLAQITRHRIASYSVQSQRYVDMTNFSYVIPPVFDKNKTLRKDYVNLMNEIALSYEDFQTRILASILSEQHPELVKKVIFNAALSFGDEAYATSLSEEVFEYWYDIEKCPDGYKEKFDFYLHTFLDAFKEEYPAIYRDTKKIAQEDARFVLPNACTTKLIVTMNARSLLNFYRLRCCSRAQWEIRELACEMLKLTKEVSPLLFKYAGPSCVKGKCPEGSMSCGKPFPKVD